MSLLLNLNIDLSAWSSHTTQKIKFSVKDFFSKCDQIRSFLRIWSYLLKKSLTENFIFRAVSWSFASKEAKDVQQIYSVDMHISKAGYTLHEKFLIVLRLFLKKNDILVFSKEMRFMNSTIFRWENICYVLSVSSVIFIVLTDKNLELHFFPTKIVNRSLYHHLMLTTSLQRWYVSLIPTCN